MEASDFLIWGGRQGFSIISLSRHRARSQLRKQPSSASVAVLKGVEKLNSAPALKSAFAAPSPATARTTALWGLLCSWCTSWGSGKKPLGWYKHTMHQCNSSCLWQGWRLEKGFLGETPVQGKGICWGWFHHGSSTSDEVFALDFFPRITSSHFSLHLPYSILLSARFSAHIWSFMLLQFLRQYGIWALIVTRLFWGIGSSSDFLSMVIILFRCLFFKCEYVWDFFLCNTGTFPKSNTKWVITPL